MKSQTLHSLIRGEKPKVHDPRRDALREAMASIFEEYGQEFVQVVVSQLRVNDKAVPSVEWNLEDVTHAVNRFLKREGLDRIEGNILFYIQIAHAIGKGRNPSALYAQLAEMEKVNVHNRILE